MGLFFIFVFEVSAVQSKATTRQEIQTIKDYLMDLKNEIHEDASHVLQDSVGHMQDLTEEVKSLKNRIEKAVNTVNEHSEANLLAIKAIEELIGLQEKKLDSKTGLLTTVSKEYKLQPATRS